MTDLDRKKALYLAIRRCILGLIAALDEYFGVKALANGQEMTAIAFSRELT
jgi:hypothetical protein